MLKRLDVTPLGKKFEQFLVNGNALRGCPQRILQDFLGLQVASVGQVDIGFGHRVDVVNANALKLAGCGDHGGLGCGAVMGIDILTAADRKVGVRTDPVIEHDAVNRMIVLALARSEKAKNCQQHDNAGACRQEWIFK